MPVKQRIMIIKAAAEVTGPVLLLKFSENFSRFRHFGRSLTETKRSAAETVNSRFRLGFQDGDAGSAGASFGTFNKISYYAIILFGLYEISVVYQNFDGIA